MTPQEIIAQAQATAAKGQSDLATRIAQMRSRTPQQTVNPNYIASSGSSSSSASGQNLQPLIQQVQNMNPQSTQTTVTNQNKSPEFEQLMQNFANTINNQATATTGASQDLANTFTNTMNALNQQYGKQATAAQQGAASGALASGLTPLEAQGASLTAAQNALSNYFPQLAALQQGQGQVGVNLQQALTQLQQSLGLPALEMAGNYNKAVAGTTATQTSNDPMAKMNLLADLAAEQARQQQSASQFQTNNQIDWAKLAEQARQFNTSFPLQQQQLAQQNAYQQGQLGLQGRGQELSAQQALAALQAQMQEAQMGNQTTIRGQDINASQNQSQLGLQQQAQQQQLLQMLMGQGNTQNAQTMAQNELLARYGQGPLIQGMANTPLGKSMQDLINKISSGSTTVDDKTLLAQ